MAVGGEVGDPSGLVVGGEEDGQRGMLDPGHREEGDVLEDDARLGRPRHARTEIGGGAEEMLRRRVWRIHLLAAYN